MTDIVERLTVENWQLKGALGYEVPGHIPCGDFKCGLCEARDIEIERLRSFDYANSQTIKQADAENKQLRVEIERLHEERARWRSDNERLTVDNDRLREELAALQASSGYQASIAQVEIERLLSVCKDKTTLLKDAYADNERLNDIVAQYKKWLIAAL